MRYTINQKVFVGFPFHIIISVTILMYATAPPPPTFLNIHYPAIMVTDTNCGF